MRGADITQSSMFSYRTLEERIPKKHPLRQLRMVVDGLLATMNEELDAVYATTGRDSIPPERLLRASLIQTLHSIRSERALIDHIDYNLLYRWFVGLGMDEKVGATPPSAPTAIGCWAKALPAGSSTRCCTWRSGKACSRMSTSRWMAH